MKNRINPLLRRIIIKNRYFVRIAPSRLSKNTHDICQILDGQNILEEMAELSTKIFKDYNKNTSVLIKVNLNSSLEYPSSLSMDILEALVSFLKTAGVKKIRISDCTALSRLPSKSIIKQKGLKSLQGKGVVIKPFDFGPWKKIKINGTHFKHILLPSIVFKYDRIINLSNLKTHRHAGFTAAAKNLVGFMHPYQRFELHSNNIEQRIAEISSAITPDLNIIDARKVFISGGPDFGEVFNANRIIIDSDLLRADIEAYKTLAAAQVSAGINGLDPDYKANPVISHLLKISEESG